MTLEQDISPILRVLQEGARQISTRRNVIWAICNLCRGKPEPNWSLLEPMLKYCFGTVARETDAELSCDLTWIMANYTQGSADLTQDSAAMSLMHRYRGVSH